MAIPTLRAFLALRCLYAGLTACLALTTSAAFADDVPGSADHLLAGRFQGASIANFAKADFDEAYLLKAPIDYGALLEANKLADRTGPQWLKLEGKVTRIGYEIPEGHSSLEVLRSYQNALTAKGFAELFACADQACFAGNTNDPYLLGTLLDPNSSGGLSYQTHGRLWVGKLDRPEGAAHVMLTVGESLNSSGAVNARAFIEIVEAKSLGEGNIKAPTMQAEIQKTGRVNVYGILFDFDKADIKPESKPVLAEIAKLMTDNPQLKLEIVGHTDNKGKDGYNMTLSDKRAAAVVAALTGEFGIAVDRLTSHGAGMTKPVASNDTEEGRAKNRRVELVSK